MIKTLNFMKNTFGRKQRVKEKVASLINSFLFVLFHNPNNQIYLIILNTHIHPVNVNTHSKNYAIRGIISLSVQKKSSRGVLQKRCFSQNWQKNTCARVSFLITLQAWACSFIKKETLAQMFSCEF